MVLYNEPKIEINDIKFSFNNGHLIKILQTRGKYIKNGDIEGAKSLEAYIIKYAIENYDSITKPVYAYITFEQEEGPFRALKFQSEWMGEKL